MRSSTLARRYARALYELAAERKEAEKVGQGLDDLVQTWHVSKELRDLFENPRFSSQLRRDILAAVAEAMGLSPLVQSTLKLLSDRRRMRFLPGVADAYHHIEEERAGRIRAEVVTATPMPDAFLQELRQTLESVTGRKVVVLPRQDPSLIGGVVARVGDKVFDGSVKNRLAQLKEELLSPLAGKSPE